MIKFINKLKEIWSLPEKNKEQYNNVLRYMSKIDNKIGERTTVHADIHYKGPSQVIVVGQYKGRDFVKAYTVSQRSFHRFIDILHEEERNANVGYMDMPSMMDFSTVYPYDKF